MAQSASRKSTSVRLIQAALRVGEVAAPRIGARWASEQWFALPRGPQASSLPAGGRPFTAEWEGHLVRGQVWGHGPAVYLMHGWGGRGDQFASLVEPLREAGFRVVLFDAPSHGASDPGGFGQTTTTGVEFAKALGAVVEKFGPAEAVVAHSMGTLATLLAMNDGLTVERLVFVAPMDGYASTMDDFQAALGFGPRTRRQVDKRVWQRVGLAADRFDVLNLWRSLPDAPPVLVAQDTRDPQSSYDVVVEIARQIEAKVVPTTGLGHNRILKDAGVIEKVVNFLRPAERDMALPATA